MLTLLHIGVILLKFIEGMVAIFNLSPMPYTIYPFPFAHKAISEDWQNVTIDIHSALTLHKAGSIEDDQ